MRKGLTLITLIAFLVIASCFDYGSNVEPKDYELLENNRAFGRKDNINIANVSGDCVIEKSTDDSIHVKLEYYFEPANCFEAQYIEDDNKLILKENFNGSCSGSSKWTITVPPEIDINFSSASGDVELAEITGDMHITTASGDISARGINADISVITASGDCSIEQATGSFQINTASGDVSGNDIKGNIFVSTASGDIKIKESSGTFQISTASGDIDASNVILENVASFSTASGDIYVGLSTTAAYNISLATASGNAILDYNGNAVEGYFEFIAKVDGGRIVSPFPFDNVETFTDGGYSYYRKSFTRVKSTPQVTIRTASGKAELRE